MSSSPAEAGGRAHHDTGTEFRQCGRPFGNAVLTL